VELIVLPVLLALTVAGFAYFWRYADKVVKPSMPKVQSAEGDCGWSYRVVKTTFQDGTVRFAIHECHYDPCGWSENPTRLETFVEPPDLVTSSTPQEIRRRLTWQLDQMRLALDRDVIEDHAIPETVSDL